MLRLVLCLVLPWVLGTFGPLLPSQPPRDLLGAGYRSAVTPDASLIVACGSGYWGYTGSLSITPRCYLLSNVVGQLVALTELATPDPFTNGTTSASNFGVTLAIDVTGSTVLLSSPGATVNGVNLAGEMQLFDVSPFRGSSPSSLTPIFPATTSTMPTPMIDAVFGKTVAMSGDASVRLGCAIYPGNYTLDSCLLFGPTGFLKWIPSPVTQAANVDVAVPNVHWGNNSYEFVQVPCNNSCICNLGQDSAVSRDGKTIVVSQDACDGGNVFVYSAADSFTQPVALGPLVPVNKLVSRKFGWIVTISPDGATIFVSSYNSGINATYGVEMFRLVGGAWIYARSFPAPAGLFSFGRSMACSYDGRFFVVGAPSANNEDGVVALFDIQSGANPVAQYTNPGSAENLGFGLGMSDDGRTIVAGAPLANPGEGAGKVYPSGSIYLFFNNYPILGVLGSANTTTVISSSLNITSNTTILGSVIISGSLSVAGSATLQVGTTTVVTVTGLLDLSASPGLAVVVPSSGQFTLVPFKFGNVSGQFNQVTVIGPCSPLSPVPQPSITTSPSSLTVVVSFPPCATTSNSPLSTGAMIGIIVGSVCGGLLLAGLVVLLAVLLRRMHTQRANKLIVHREIKQL